MSNSRQVGGLVGPTIVAMLVFAASQYRQVTASTSSSMFMILEGCLLVVGITITVRAYSRGAS